VDERVERRSDNQAREVVSRDARLSVTLLVIRGLFDLRSSGQPLSMGGAVRK
jgi:hypothetical protein